MEKQERSQINNLILCLKELEKEEQTESKVSRRKKIVKMRAEINITENRKNNRKDFFLIQKILIKLRVGSLKRYTKLTNP